MPTADDPSCVHVDVAYLGDALGQPGFLTLGHDSATGRVVAATFGPDIDAAGFVRVLCGIGPDPERTIVIRRGTARPTTIVVDDAVNFHAASFRDQAVGLGISIHHAPAPQPEAWFAALRRALASRRRLPRSRDAAERLRRWLELHETTLCRDGTRWDRRHRATPNVGTRGRAQPGRAPRDDA